MPRRVECRGECRGWLILQLSIILFIHSKALLIHYETTPYEKKSTKDEGERGQRYIVFPKSQPPSTFNVVVAPTVARASSQEVLVLVLQQVRCEIIHEIVSLNTTFPKRILQIHSVFPDSLCFRTCG